MNKIKTDCFKCKHFSQYHGTCEAFPGGIPFGVGVTKEHTRPLIGQQNRLVFEQKI